MISFIHSVAVNIGVACTCITTIDFASTFCKKNCCTKIYMLCQPHWKATHNETNRGTTTVFSDEMTTTRFTTVSYAHIATFHWLNARIHVVRLAGTIRSWREACYLVRYVHGVRLAGTIRS